MNDVSGVNDVQRTPAAFTIQMNVGWMDVSWTQKSVKPPRPPSRATLPLTRPRMPLRVGRDSRPRNPGDTRKNLNRRERKDLRPEHGLGSAHNLRAASAATADPTRTIAIHARSTRVRPAPGSPPARLAASSL